MDPVTHGLIGATAAQSFSRTAKLRAASIVGMGAAMLADLDVLISDPADPLLQLEYHRQFSHALVFIPVGALIASAVLWWFVRKRLTFRETYLFSLLGYATSGAADTMTSYGTRLLWPFVETRFDWNIISVFDPLFTLGIVIAAGLAFYHTNRRWTWIAWGWMVCYLLLGIFQQHRAAEAGRDIASANGHHIDRMVIKPTIANQLVWSIRYQSGDSLFAHGVRLVPFVEPRVYQGKAARLLDWQNTYTNYRGSTLFHDLKRFDRLSDGYLIRHPDRPNIIGDGRYAMLPTSMKPLWGVEVDTANAQRHLPFRTFREAGADVRNNFLQMLTGN